MNLCKGCFGICTKNEDSQPYETARATFSPNAVPMEDLCESPVLKEPVVKSDDAAQEDPSYLQNATSCVSGLTDAGKAAQFLSLLDAHCFNPPLCSTKIGEGTPTKSSSLPELEVSVLAAFGKTFGTRSLETAETVQTKRYPLRRMTVSCALDVAGLQGEGVDRSPLLEKNATGGAANLTSPLKISSCDQEVLCKRTEACIKCNDEAIDKRTFVIVDRQPTEANNDFTIHTSADCIHQENMLHQSREAGDQDSSFQCQFPDLPVIRKSIDGVEMGARDV